ncbi:hypothetical protein HDU99_008605, partial [Rhizoclosmatium hyalinum]
MYSSPLNESIRGGLTQKTPASAITQLIYALEAPILASYHYDWYIEDPDLMPTMEDFECVLTFVTHNLYVSTLMFTMDIHGFMMTFFTQPAPLR